MVHLNKYIKDYSIIILGCLLIALGLNIFIVPHNLAMGGIFGLSIILNHFFDFSIGNIALFINIPILAISAYFFGIKSGIKTVIATILCSVSIDLISYLVGDFSFTKNELLASVFGGITLGSGVGLILSTNSSTGGTDTIAAIISKYYKISLPVLFFSLDAIIVITSAIVFRNSEIIAFAILTIFFTSKSIDLILQYTSKTSTISISSENHEAIRSYILNDLERGGTYYITKGLFNNKGHQKVIQCTLNNGELKKLLSFLRKFAPNAFVTIQDSPRVFGKGFAKL